jgi:hypothetical protein
MRYIQKPVLRIKSWVNPNFQLSQPVHAKSAQLEGMKWKVPLFERKESGKKRAGTGT